MRSTIEELYYGNINPGNRMIRRDSEYAHLINLVSKNEEDLAATLTEAQKETFEKFKDCVSEMHGIDEVTVFALGFKLGLRLAVESLITIKPELELIND